LQRVDEGTSADGVEHDEPLHDGQQ
jgi:hypothetical protein